MKTISRSFIALAALSALSGASSAHVSLEESRAEAGRPYRAVLRVGHGCDKSATTSVAVQLPPGFDAAKPQAKPGWTVVLRGSTATWTASSKEAALPDGQKGEFVVGGTLPRAPGPLWFKVLQTCEQGSLDWSQLPAAGTSIEGLKTPAALLEVMNARDWAQLQSLPKVEGAWVRSSVPGQQGTGAFMKLTAKHATRLVGASTPVAGVAEVHEMTMEGDVMRMRALDKLDLPAGRTVELSPGGLHIMLQDLKQPLAKDSTVPLTLLFRDAKGVESRLELKVPVAVQPAGAHKH